MNPTASSLSAANDDARVATLYRMETDRHVCPYGLKARELLQRKGFQVQDRLLRTRADQDAFKAEHEVATTPQVFIGSRRIGGYDALREFFGMKPLDRDAVSYQPVVAIFALTALMAIAASKAAFGEWFTALTLPWFVALSMCVLAIQKLQDLHSFANSFLGYDLLARRVVPYAYVYPFAEALAGVLMIAGVLPWLSGPLALAIGSIGAVSVIKAVYIDGREIRCACVGGNSRVPLGPVSLTENLLMTAMGLWTLYQLVTAG
ncbi:MAG: glutaredoxin [Gammaproteobacteria bacterium]|nr:glutaredoxin [Gammaproteobacteria bacterium]